MIHSLSEFLYGTVHEFWGASALNPAQRNDESDRSESRMMSLLSSGDILLLRQNKILDTVADMRILEFCWYTHSKKKNKNTKYSFEVFRRESKFLTA